MPRKARSEPVVGTGVSIRNPVGKYMMRSLRNSRGKLTDVLTGTDKILSIDVGSSGAVAGTVLANIPVNPYSFSTTRLQQFAPLYERFEFLNSYVSFEPAANTTINGQIAMWWDPDPTNNYTDGDSTNVNKGLAHWGCFLTQLWDKASCPIGKVDDFGDFFTTQLGDDERLFNQGRLWLIAASTIAANTPIGTFSFAYNCAFHMPQIQSVGMFMAGTAQGVSGMATGTILGTGGIIPDSRTGGFQQNLLIEYTSGTNRINLPNCATNALMLASCVLSGTSIGTLACTANSSCTVVGSSTGGAGASLNIGNFVIQCTGDNPVFTIDATCTAITTARLWVTCLPAVTSTLTSAKQEIRRVESESLALIKELSDKMAAIESAHRGLLEGTVKQRTDDSDDDYDCRCSDEEAERGKTMWKEMNARLLPYNLDVKLSHVPVATRMPDVSRDVLDKWLSLNKDGTVVLQFDGDGTEFVAVKDLTLPSGFARADRLRLLALRSIVDHIGTSGGESDLGPYAVTPRVRAWVETGK